MSLSTSSTSTLLKGKIALVTGATGEVGRGAAYALSAAGAYVYLAGRSLDKLSAIQQTLPHPELSSVIAADYSSVDGAKSFQHLVNETFPTPVLDVVVGSSGPWWPAKYIADAGTDLDTLYNATQSNFNTHLFLYNILVPKLRPTTGHYLLVNGSAANNIAGFGVTAVMSNALAGAAQLMYAQSQNDDSSLHPHLFTHVMISSYIGHPEVMGPTTNDPIEYGKVFVALALNQHTNETDEESGKLDLVDSMAAKLIARLPQ